MKTSHLHSIVSTFLSAFFALTFICHGVSSLAQTKNGTTGEKTAFIISKIDAAAAKEFQEAWHVSRNGSDGFEGLVLVYPTTDGSIQARSQGKSAEQKHFTFGWTSNIIAVVHTHPNGVDPKPAGDDLRLADKFGVPVFTITQRGMYVYDPQSRKISMVQAGLDWLESAKWTQDRQALAQRK
jgi:proteasome lid subunit RPN8/RPN11